MESHPIPLEKLRLFMATQWYVAGRAELVARGFSLTMIRSWLRTGRLIAVIRGVYSYGRDIETPEAAWKASLIAAGQDAVLAGRSACELWGLVRPTGGIPRLIEVIRPGGCPISLNGISPAMRRTRIRIFRRELDGKEIRRKAGIRVTSPARALIDFAAFAPATQVKFAFLEACRLKLFGRRDVDYCFRKIAGRRGAGKLRPLLASWVPELSRTRSVLEGLFLLEWVGTRLEMPKVNVRIHGFEVDFYWPALGIVVELDGAAFHSDFIARQRDEVKTKALQAQGLIVIRISFREMMDDPAQAIRRVAAALAGRRKSESWQ
jgi:very-short-patch-repair endonuclease